MLNFFIIIENPLTDSNHRFSAYKEDALPTWPRGLIRIISDFKIFFDFSQKYYHKENSKS
ncbi:hypothetical protein pb186bvf_001482 [Paramecium bursaria]